MCIIVYKPKGVSVKKEIYQNCFDNNKDGAGYIVREKSGELKLEKGFFTFQDFWNSFEEHQGKQAIVHFRIATHGEVDTNNCHPFWVAENKLAFAHNGVISTSREKDTSMSDTYHFNVNILSHLKEKMGDNFVDDPVIQELISSYIGGSRLAFMSETGRVWLFNKSLGVKEKDVWYSNYSFRKWGSAFKTYNRASSYSHSGYTSDDTPIPITPANDPPQTSIVLAPANLPGSTLPRFYPPLSSTIKQYDYIELLQPYKDLKGTEVGLVQAVLSHGLVQVKVFDHNAPAGFKIRALPIGVFRKYKDAHSTMGVD